MDFGITFKGVVRPERARALVRQAENAGFTYCWFYDSHILWRESFVAIAMLMEHTTKMRFGPCVTNPNTRDWSLAASLFGSLAMQSGGRFELGVGRGDSAVRVMGKKPAKLAHLEEFVRDHRPHGPLTADATEPAWHGYPLTLATPRSGVGGGG